MPRLPRHVPTGGRTGIGCAARACQAAAIALLVTAVGLAAAPSGAQTARTSIERDISYGRQPQLLLDAYLPRGSGPHPAILWLHGGRWGSGDKSQDDDLLTELASDGFAVFSANYRLIKDAPYPAAVEDAETAVEWIRDNAADYDVDPARIGAVGVSSGAQLAGLLATLGEGPLDTGARISAAVSLSGPMNMATPIEEDPESNLGRSILAFLACDPGPECETTAEEASPVSHVDPTDAPIFLANSTDEVIPLDQATEMQLALEDAGVTAELVVIDGEQHATGYARDTKGVPGGVPISQQYLEFLRQHVAGEDLAAASPSPEGPVPGPTETPIAAPPAEPPGGGSSWLSWVFLLVALGAVAGIVAQRWIARKRRLHPY